MAKTAASRSSAEAELDFFLPRRYCSASVAGLVDPIGMGERAAAAAAAAERGTSRNRATVGHWSSSRGARRMAVLGCLVLAALPTLGDYARAASCDRDCSTFESPMVCEYDMEISYYYTMSSACLSCPYELSDCLQPQCIAADGFKRAVTVVNRMLPGPQIRVCENDTIVVNVKNQLSAGDTTTIHWHGIHQRNTPYMDGVSALVQCPILPRNSFQYRFAAAPAGTHYWHSHVGFQRGDGAAGAFVVKSRRDVHRSRYDFDLPEHTVVIQDWSHTLTVDAFTSHYNSKTDTTAESILINGKGDFQPYRDSEDGTLYTPTAVFRVEHGNRYRFRVIGNQALNCPIEISIDDHRLLVIAMDGSPTEPLLADVITISGGERFDFVLAAEEEPDNYWFYARGLGDCSRHEVQQLAVVHYEEEPHLEPATLARPWRAPREGVVVSPLNHGVAPQEYQTAITAAHLKSAVPLEDWVYKEPHATFYLSIDMNLFNNSRDSDHASVHMPQINFVTNMLLGSPALTRFRLLNQSQVCYYPETSHSISGCDQKYRQCMHIIKVKSGDIIEMVLIDPGSPIRMSSHAIHLHGQYFRIMNMWQHPQHITTKQDVIKMDYQKSTRPITSRRPIQKDTIVVPEGGYVVTKFKANSPGLWFMHCHNELHALAGMSITIQVGEPEEWPAPVDFPTCGSWKPTSLE